jgi:hypothetical protein
LVIFKNFCNCSGTPQLRGLFGGRELRRGTFEGEESILNTSYGGEKYLQRVFVLERHPVELPLGEHLNSYKKLATVQVPPQGELNRACSL